MEQMHQEKIGGRFLQELRGEVHCSCFRDVVIDQIIGLHCIAVSSYGCCHQVSDFKAKCTKFDFGWGSAPDPAGELTALPQTP